MVLTDSFSPNRRTLSRHVRSRREGQRWRTRGSDRGRILPAVTPGVLPAIRAVHLQGQPPVTSGRPAQGHRHSPNMRHSNDRTPRAERKFPAELTGTLHPLDTPAPLTRASRPWLGMCDCQRKPMVSHLVASGAVPTLPWQEPVAGGGRGRLVPAG